MKVQVRFDIRGCVVCLYWCAVDEVVIRSGPGGYLRGNTAEEEIHISLDVASESCKDPESVLSVFRRVLGNIVQSIDAFGTRCLPAILKRRVFDVGGRRAAICAFLMTVGSMCLFRWDREPNSRSDEVDVLFQVDWDVISCKQVSDQFGMSFGQGQRRSHLLVTCNSFVFMTGMLMNIIFCPEK